MINYLQDSQNETFTIDWNELWNQFIAWCTTTGVKFIIALVVLIIIFIFINWTAKGIRKGLRKKKKDETIVNAVFSTYRKVLKFLAILVFLGVIGFDMTGISSIVASATVAIGLALQGSLSNIAGWVLIIVTRPFKLGDYIVAQGVEGSVEEINLFYTHLKTFDNKQVTIPNGNLSANVIINYSAKDVRRLDLKFEISYDEDANKVIEIISNVVNNHQLVLDKPAPFVRVGAYEKSSTVIYTRVWVKTPEYWDANWDLLEQVRKALNDNNIKIPYNKLEINTKK